MPRNLRTIPRWKLALLNLYIRIAERRSNRWLSGNDVADRLSQMWQHMEAERTRRIVGERQR